MQTEYAHERSAIADLLHASDAMRRSVGSFLDALGAGPVETPWEARVTEPGFIVRRYGDSARRAAPVLIIPAPIKRPYVFDLVPQVSVVRRLLEAGFAVYLLAWRDAGEDGAEWGLAEYAGSWIRAAVDEIAREHGREAVLIGHSLGGTLAAVFAASMPERVRKLLLIGAPLRFGEDTGALAPLVAASPRAERVARGAGGAPGSLLDIASAIAAPEELVAGRWQDAWASCLDPAAMPIHVRVMRWTLDEFAQPARLFAEVVELLYRGDAFARGELRIAEQPARPAALAGLPVAVVVDPTSRLVPASSMLSPLTNPAVFAYAWEAGVALQHVGPLVGRRAHHRLWPQLIAWIREAGSC